MRQEECWARRHGRKGFVITTKYACSDTFRGQTNVVIAQVEFIDPPKDAKIGERVRACARALAYLLYLLCQVQPVFT